ncbi:MAG: DUF3987 domain-containing protein [Planctomycetes bacterium]|nr:DUF3987 domain-containing protein [Planctomycetota bacterium]
MTVFEFAGGVTITAKPCPDGHQVRVLGHGESLFTATVDLSALPEREAFERSLIQRDGQVADWGDRLLLVSDYLSHAADESNVNGGSPADSETPLRLPQEVWRPTIDDYRLALEGVTEAADEHHFTAFVTMVGSLLGRRVFVHNAYRLYPNIYSLNVGPAGSTKKTTVQRLASDVGRRVDENLAIQSAVGSGEGLLEALAEADSALGQHPMHRRLLLIQSEMGQLLSKARQDGSGTLISYLLDVFDCPSVINPRTRMKPITAYKPTLSLMAASTPAHLARYVQDADWYGGFGSRLFISVAEPKDPIPRPSRPEPSRLNKVVGDIHGAIERWQEETEFKMTDESMRRWDAWYVANKKHEGKLGEAADVVSRTAPYALKLALIFAALENDTAVIEDGQLEAGILAAEFSQKCALLLLDEIGESKTVKLEARIMRKLAKGPGTTRRKLQQSVGGRGIDSELFNRTVKAMLEGGKIYLREADGGLFPADGDA